jgi:hypothetical protein
MSDTLIVLGIWALFLAASIPYALRARHPEQKPVAAIAIFVFVFSAVAFFLYRALTWLLVLAGAERILADPWAAVPFLIVVFAPAFLLGRWLIRKPPRRAPPI